LIGDLNLALFHQKLGFRITYDETSACCKKNEIRMIKEYLCFNQSGKYLSLGFPLHNWLSGSYFPETVEPDCKVRYVDRFTGAKIL
jgi:hypothetical protein